MLLEHDHVNLDGLLSDLINALDVGFDVATGNALYGPPPRPLDVIELEVRDAGEVWAVGRKAGQSEHAI